VARRRVRVLRMSELPAACALDADGARLQRDRYAAIGRGARIAGRTSTRLDVELAPATDDALVERALAVERDCCPFFTLAFEPPRLTVAVDEEHAPALDAIVDALGLSGGGAPAPSATSAT
jgi:hypothetical protein